MANLLEVIKSHLSPALVNQAADMLGEKEANVYKVLAGIAPVMLAGMLHKSKETGAMDAIFGLISDRKNIHVLDDPGALLNNGNLAHDDPKDTAGEILGQLFGHKVPAIINALSAFAGVKAGSTSSLLGVGGPLVMGVLSQKINSEGLNVTGLINLLKEEKDSILATLPGGLAALAGIGKVRIYDDPEPSSGNRWLLPLFLLLALGGGIIFYMKQCAYKGRSGEISIETPAKTDTVAVIPTPAPVGFTRQLKTGFELKGNKSGIESQLVAFIEDNTKPVDKTTWFNFDRLLFETGSATIDMGKSSDQLNNMVEILKAFPQVSLKIGGYTDNVGDKVSNMKLSQARADAVRIYLLEHGIDKTRVVAEGYGSDHPVADNGAEEGRAQNRRIAVRVAEK